MGKRSKSNNQSRRLLSLAAVLDGMNRMDAARIGGMDRQTLRDWVRRFNESGPDGLLDHWAGGREPRLSAEQKAAFAAVVESGPVREIDGVVRWRRVDLQRVFKERFGVAYHERHVGVLLKTLGVSHVSARPRHPGQDVEIMEVFPRALSVHLGDAPAATPIEIWFQDEARIGQKNGLVRRWARRGTWPSPPTSANDNAYLFGAICPAAAKARDSLRPTPTRKPCRGTLKKYCAMSPRALTPC